MAIPKRYHREKTSIQESKTGSFGGGKVRSKKPEKCEKGDDLSDRGGLSKPSSAKKRGESRRGKRFESYLKGVSADKKGSPQIDSRSTT